MNDNKSAVGQIVESIKKIQYIQPDEIPNIDLYMDQVTTFMDQHLESFKRYDADKLLTKTMINNYTKNNLLPSPDKKKYSKDHMFLLIFIYYMKNVMSITDIQSVLKPLSDKFFGRQASIDLEGIYKEVFRVEGEQIDKVIKDIIRKFHKAMEAFPELEQEEDAEFLRVFTFLSMLCVDIYFKKQLMEKMIDEYFCKAPANEQEKTKDKSKNKNC